MQINLRLTPGNRKPTHAEDFISDNARNSIGFMRSLVSGLESDHSGPGRRLPSGTMVLGGGKIARRPGDGFASMAIRRPEPQGPMEARPIHSAAMSLWR